MEGVFLSVEGAFLSVDGFLSVEGAFLSVACVQASLDALKTSVCRFVTHEHLLQRDEFFL